MILKDSEGNKKDNKLKELGRMLARDLFCFKTTKLVNPNKFWIYSYSDSRLLFYI